MSLWTYTAMLWAWNEAHSEDGDEPVELPSADQVRRSFAMAEQRGMTH